MRMPAGAAAIFALALLLGALVSPRPARAHALLIRADPPVNSQVREPPSLLTLYFSEALERKVSTVRVFDTNRQRFDTGVEFDDQDDALMRVKVSQLTPGFYSVAWETLSKVDGHRIAGSYPITVLNADGSQPAGTAPSAEEATVSGTRAKPERVATKWALLLAGSVVTGALAFGWLLRGLEGEHAGATREAATRRIIAAGSVGLVVLAAAGFVDLLLQADAVFGSVSEFRQTLWDTRWGERWTLRNALVPALALGFFALSRRGSDGKGAGLLFVVVVGIALAYLAMTSVVSHAAAGRGSVWATASDFAHLVGSSVWIGMLLQLALLARWARRGLPRSAQPAVLAGALRRFSVVAVVSVALLLFTGVFNSSVQLNRPSDLLDTGYGLALLIKLLLLIPLLIAGGLNAYLFRPQVVEEAERAETGRLGGVSGGWEELDSTVSRTVRVEVGLAAAVLLAVGVLTQVAPPRNALSAPELSGRFTETKTADDVTITLDVDPNEPGQNTFQAYLAGNVTPVERIRLIFETQRKDSFQSELILGRSPSNALVYVGAGPYLDQVGKWKVTAELRRNQNSDLTIPFAMNVAGPGGVTAPGSRGGAFETPRDFSTEAVALLVLSGALCAGLVLASLDRPGRPGGLMGDWADRLAVTEVRPSVSLAALVVVGIGLGIIVGTHGHDILGTDQARKGNVVPSSPQSIERGRQLFLQNCAQCHGETGRGDGPLASSLRLPPANFYEHVPYHPDKFFFSVITNGLGGVMPAFGSALSEKDRWNILNFLREQFGQGAATQ